MHRFLQPVCRLSQPKEEDLLKEVLAILILKLSTLFTKCFSCSAFTSSSHLLVLEVCEPSPKSSCNFQLRLFPFHLFLRSDGGVVAFLLTSGSFKSALVRWVSVRKPNALGDMHTLFEWSSTCEHEFTFSTVIKSRCKSLISNYNGILGIVWILWPVDQRIWLIVKR